MFTECKISVSHRNSISDPNMLGQAFEPCPGLKMFLFYRLAGCKISSCQKKSFPTETCQDKRLNHGLGKGISHLLFQIPQGSGFDLLNWRQNDRMQNFGMSQKFIIFYFFYFFLFFSQISECHKM
jgi:hypothetical protein